MEKVFLPSFIQDYHIEKKGACTQPFWTKNSYWNANSGDRFEKMDPKYTSEQKLEILKGKGVDEDIVYDVLEFNDRDFDRFLEIAEFCKDRTSKEAYYIPHLCKMDNFDGFAREFMQFDINPSEIGNALKLSPKQLKSILNELRKTEGLSENYTSKLFDVHIGVNSKDESAVIICAFKTDGIKAVKEDSLDTKNVTIIKRVNKNGQVSAQRIEDCKDGIIESRAENSGVTFYTRADDGVISEQFEVSNDKIIHLKKSPLIEGVYDSVEYLLSDYDETLDVQEEIKQGRIKGGKSRSFAVKDSFGNLAYEENVNNTKRKYVQKEDGFEYTIETPFFDFKRVRKKLSDNKISETVNGKKYIAEFDDKNKKISINGKIIDIDALSKQKGEISKQDAAAVAYGFLDIKDVSDTDSDELWSVAKTVPLDILYDFDLLKKWTMTDSFFRWDDDRDLLRTNSDIAIIAHEMGHATDRRKFAFYKDPCLLEIFNREKEAFDKHYTAPSGADNMKHLFSGLNEIAAESNLVFATFGGSMRSRLLFEYFPETISYIGQKIFS